MATSIMNPKVDFFFEKAKQWKDEFGKLREIALDCRLMESLKWGQPCYMSAERNVVLIHGFKEYCALLFFKGALLKDPKGILVQQTDNVQAARQIRFTSLKEIVKLEPAIKSYIKAAIEIEEAGLKVPLKEAAAFPVPEEFKKVLDKKPAVKAAFYALTPGRQRAYLLFFAAAKQSKTREARVEKSVPDILKGKGLND